MAPRLYVESSIVSYLTARPSRDLIMAARQAITQEWWLERRTHFELVTSEAVLEEAAAGDASFAQSRVDLLKSMRLLTITEGVEVLAGRLIDEGPLPSTAYFDALHIATAALHGVEYLMTWNCRHIANAAMRPGIERLCRLCGHEPPILCTPEELIDD